jgi:hypothetical protein
MQIFCSFLDRGFKRYFRENFRVFFGKVSDFETGVLYRKIFNSRNSGFPEFWESQKSENFPNLSKLNLLTVVRF